MKTTLLRGISISFFAILCATAAQGALGAAGVALVTRLDGGVTRLAGWAQDQKDDQKEDRQPVRNFVRLLEGDVLELAPHARLQVTYFDGGRQESWTGAGTLEVAKAASRPTGLDAPQVRQLPAILVKQLARTPALDTHGRPGATRLRAVPTAEAIARVEQTYAKLRKAAPADDLTPEFYRLSSYFDMREIERVEGILADLHQKRALDPQVGMLVSLYREAIFRTQKPESTAGH